MIGFTGAQKEAGYRGDECPSDTINGHAPNTASGARQTGSVSSASFDARRAGRRGRKRNQRGLVERPFDGTPAYQAPRRYISGSDVFSRSASDSPPSLIGPHLLSPAGFGPASGWKGITALVLFVVAVAIAGCGGGSSGGNIRSDDMMVAPSVSDPVAAPESESESESPVPVPESVPEPTPPPAPESESETQPEPVVPPTPTGLTVSTGIEIALLFWDNPHVRYNEHALTHVYRSTTNDFNNAVQIGQSSGITYVDRQVVGDQTYYYWIVWQSTDGTTGLASNVVHDTPAVDPQKVIEELSEEILNDQLTRDLLSLPISVPAHVASELARIKASDLNAAPPALPSAPAGLSLNRVGSANTAVETTTVNDQTQVTGNTMSVSGWGFWGGKGGNMLFSIGINGTTDTGFSTYADGILSGSNPVSGSAVWRGGVNALDPERGTIYGNARVTANLSAATVDVSFTDFTVGRDDMSWSGLSLSDGVFQSSTITGAFFGDGHEGVAGRFSRDRLNGVFGALRQ